jgi:hypothetical protein
MRAAELAVAPDAAQHRLIGYPVRQRRAGEPICWAPPRLERTEERGWQARGVDEAGALGSTVALGSEHETGKRAGGRSDGGVRRWAGRRSVQATEPTRGAGR